MTTETATHFEARTALGKPIKTFNDRKLALAWWAKNAATYPGAKLGEVTRTVNTVFRTVRAERLRVVGGDET